VILVGVLRFAIALALLPIAVSLSRQIRFTAGRPYYAVAVGAIYVAMALSILEDIVPIPVALNTLQHCSYAVSGVFAAIAAYHTRREALSVNRAA